MWRQVQMIGRDDLLKKQIYPRCQGKKTPFLLVGGQGVGKTSLLQWAFTHGQAPKAFISAAHTIRESLIEIAKSWELEIKDGEKTILLSRAKISDLEAIIMKQISGTIYIDDIHEAKPTFLRRFKVWRERFKVFAAGTPPFKREKGMI